MAVGAGTDANANPGLKRRAGPGPVTGVAPAMLAAPALSGPGLVGAALSVDPGVWGGVPAPAVALRWRRDGVDVPGASTPDYLPGAADDGTELRCVVTATNASGSASAATEAVRITRAAPAATGAIADRVLDQGRGAVTLDASAAFTGAALVFDAAGAGAVIDPATGLLTIPDDAPRADETVAVTATNSGGSASVSFTVTVTAAPVLTAPASLVAPSLAGPGRVGAPMRVDPGTWSGDPTPVLSLRWTRNGADIPGAEGDEYLPVPADDGTDLRGVVSATNAAGSAEAATAPIRIAHAAPSARAPLADAVFDQGDGTASLPTAQAFAGEDLTFGVTGAGATIDPATGWVGLGTDLPRAAETVTVTATNSGGSASASFTVTVIAAPVDTTAPVLTAGAFDVAASPATLSFTADEGGTAFWTVDGAATRDAAEVEAGGGAASGSFDIGAGATARDIGLDALAPGAWVLHLMVRDAAGNRSEVISSAFDLAPADLTAPVLSGMAVTPGPTGAALSVSTDEAGGALHWMVDAAATRSAAEILAGGGAASGARPVDAAGLQAPVEAAGLSPATGYRFHVLHEDAAGNRSAVVSTAFVTASPASGGIRVERSAVTVSSSGGPAYAGSEFVVGDADDRVLVALVHGYSAAAGAVPDDVSISFRGAAMTPALAPATDADLDHREWVAAYVLAAPPSGPGTLALDWSSSTRACAVTLVEVSGVDQAAPVVASGIVESGIDAALAFTRPAAAEGSLLLSALAINSGGRGADIGVTGGATELRKGETGSRATSDVSFATASQTVTAGGPKGHGYAWTPADRAILGWLEMKEA